MKSTIRNRSFFARLSRTKFTRLVFSLAALAPISLVQGGNLVFPDALVAHWAFDEMTGTIVRDSSTNGFDGTVVGGLWTNGLGHYDGALDLAGGHDGVFIPADGSPAPDKIANLAYGSIAIRFGFHPTGSGAVIPVFCMGQRTAERAEQLTLILEIGHAYDPANRKLYFTIINSGFCFDTGVNLQADTWYHYVGVVGTNGNTGYLNGQELVGRHYNLGSNASYTNFFSSVPCRECLSVGCGRFASDFVYGPTIVSDIQIYNRPLTADEVSRLYADTMDPALFKISGPSLSPEGDGMVFTWPSGGGYVYSVWRTDTLPCQWQVLPGLEAIPATPPVNSVTIPVDSVPMGMFRVQATWQGQPNP